MHYGHGPCGLLGITLNEKAVHRWAMSLHICSRLMKDVADVEDSLSLEIITTTKEELASRTNMMKMTSRSWKNCRLAWIP